MAREKQVDLIGLSGLITPSLDEMVHVAREMEREGFPVPLLIGGATTSRAHTAVKIAPAYHQPVVHVLDASRAVGVVASLQSPEQRDAFAAENRREQQHTARAAQRPARRAAALARGSAPAARRNSIGAPTRRPCRRSPASRVWESVPLDALVPLIDWTPFFHAWELKGIYPRIFEDAGGRPARQGAFRRRANASGGNRREERAHRARRGRILSRQ